MTFCLESARATVAAVKNKRRQKPDRSHQRFFVGEMDVVGFIGVNRREVRLADKDLRRLGNSVALIAAFDRDLYREPGEPQITDVNVAPRVWKLAMLETWRTIKVSAKVAIKVLPQHEQMPNLQAW
jgi:hypothetical protein